MSINSQLERIINAKDALVNVLNIKKLSVSKSSVLEEIAATILNIDIPIEWSETHWNDTYKAALAKRPSDWLSLPTVLETEQKVVGLFAVYEHDNNYVAVTCAGNYTVDWGDGTIENINSGIQAQHQYTYINISDATICSLGYKQVIITITPQNGQNLTSVNFNVRHTALTKIIPVSWLDIVVSSPQLSSLTVSSNSRNIQLVNLRYFSLLSKLNTLTDMSYMFIQCRSLQTIPALNTSAVTNMSSMFIACTALQAIPALNTSAVTNMSSMFNGCATLQAIPLLNTSAVTNMSSMFRGCTTLQTIPELNTSAVTDMSYMFGGCTALQAIPALNTSAVTDMSYMFYLCRPLQTIPALNTSAVTNMSSMFNGCATLQTIPTFNTSAVTNMSSMFYSCTTLQAIPTFNTSAVTNMSSMFTHCRSLQTIPTFNTSAVTNMSSMFYNCAALQTIPDLNVGAVTDFTDIFTITPLGSCKMTNIKSNISFKNCNLSATQINNIFNNLVDLTGKPTQTITITSNPGTSTCTKTIATNKNWTVNTV